ncbi:calcium-binding protein [Loktanella sp. 3ANDIMAR09]|uniref:calcium-binding protein n=1 Tax=Loktanella sp. 3ANDIMAR09 TaxID=1225657 RepID=UPI0006FA150B|nr:calcium-binding protein [Loktanella sp. 3ANDIMAR09]
MELFVLPALLGIGLLYAFTTNDDDSDDDFGNDEGLTLGQTEVSEQVDLPTRPGPDPDADQTLTGTPEDDTLIGAAGDDEIEAFRGNDLLDGKAGDDFLNGAAGDDILRGGRGNDLLIGGSGADDIDGEDGDDLILPGVGGDVTNGGDGNDIIIDEQGFDIIYGGAGDDIIASGRNPDTVFGGDGDDIIVYQGEAGVLSGDDGDDVMVAINEFSSPDGTRMDGGAGNDVMSGIGDSLFGGTGDDTLGTYEPEGADAGKAVSRLNGGFGDDTLISADGDALLTGNQGTDSFVATTTGKTTIFDFDPATETVEFQVELLNGLDPDTTPAPSLVIRGVGADTQISLSVPEGQSGLIQNEEQVVILKNVDPDDLRRDSVTLSLLSTADRAATLEATFRPTLPDLTS